MKHNRKTFTRIFALLLAAILTAGMLVGCGGDSGGGSAGQGETGRFLESEVELPEGFQLQTITKLDDGSLGAGGILYDQEADKVTYCLLRSSDLGQTWETVREEETPDVAQSVMAPDGGASVISIEANEDDGDYSFSYTLYQIPVEGDIAKQKLTLPDEQDMILQIVRDESGSLFLVDVNHDLLAVDLDTGKCSPIGQDDGVSTEYCGIAGKTLFAVNEDGVRMIDTESGKSEDADGALSDVVKNNDYAFATSTEIGLPMAFAAGEDDSILFVNHEGIFTHKLGGSINEQLVDGSLVSLNDTSIVFLDAVQMDTDNIFVAVLGDDGSEQLLHYAYDAETAAVPEKELTVYTLTESTLLRQAVTAFQKSNPDTYVKLEVGMTGDDGVTAEDAIKLLNTNIMAGKGPDVLILDGLPMDSYVEKGILEDISDVVDAVEKEDGLFENIRDAYKQDGKQYVMPVRFFGSLVAGNADTVAAGGSLKKLADRGEQLKKQDSSKNVFSSYTKQTFLLSLYEADSASWTQGDSIDAEKLRDFLTQAKRLYDLDDYSEFDKQAEAEGYDGIEVDGIKISTLNGLGIVGGSGQMSVGTPTGLGDIQLMYSVQREYPEIEFAPADTDSVSSFVPYLMTGVVSGGDTETAKQFVKMLLGKDIGNQWTDGFATNRASYESSADAMMNSDQMVSTGFSDENGNMVTIEGEPMTQEQINAMTRQLESLTQPSITDRVIRDLVLDQGLLYLDGTQDLDTTVNEIQKKINLYLSE
ncbi:MAG: extracellular solute-binding protein [Eubacteriales bacterium]|nr:extracellular solute-binding protein [Eubacteriales bacterium]